ncbi:hypothetical protein [Methylorubrum populi]|uniref:hypothetical protein n=1 Tax=Methylorubrum populi TaxID=223967 RepID=UPI0012FF85E1|nr:hypothetical protein [Methylorubrum populi]
MLRPLWQAFDAARSFMKERKRKKSSISTYKDWRKALTALSLAPCGGGRTGKGDRRSIAAEVRVGQREGIGRVGAETLRVRRPRRPVLAGHNGKADPDDGAIGIGFERLREICPSSRDVAQRPSA